MMALVRKNLIFVSLAVLAFLLFMPGLSEANLSADDAKTVWSRVAKATELTDLPFNVKQETVPNAWVTNDSSVTVTTGLLELLDTQSELYGVLSHEAGHAKLNHYENTVKRGVGLSVAAALFGKLFGGGIAETAAGVGANLAYAGWSREQEVEADDYSVHLAHKMGEDPVGLYSALLKLSKSGKRGEPSGFNSHPPDERRLLHLRNEILSLNPKAKFPDGSEKEAVQQPQSYSVGEPENTAAQKGGYDIDAAIERMKKEEAAKAKAGEQNS
ncbi:MAG TPA: peptidase M48 [Synergistaceae bacterium]|nr:peptidase M48 [Synergistaceae bacterium]